MKKISFAAVLLLTIGLTPAVRSATLDVDFSKGQLGDWEVVSGEAAFKNGGLAASSPKGEDGAHATFLARSPAFRLDESGDLNLVLKGGRGGGTPKSARDLLQQTQTHGKGALGAALRRVSDDAYLLSAQKNGNGGEQTFKFNKTSISKLREAAQDEVYTLDFFDGHHGGWGHVELVRANIPGTRVEALPAAPKDFGKPDRTIYMGTKHNQLLFDKTELWFTPGSKVAFNLYNTDEMGHNFILCKPSKTITKELGEYVLANLEAAMKNKFYMKDPRILAQTQLVEPGTSETIYFTAPEQTGDYPYLCTFPGHHLIMLGVVHVVDQLPDPKTPKGIASRPSDPFTLTLDEKPILIRGPLKGSGSASICIGTPSGVHYAFDTERCILAKVWRGDQFINTKRAWNGRGGQALTQSGDIFTAKEAFPLRIGDNAEPSVNFTGYRLMPDGYPVFQYTIDAVAVTQRIVPVNDGAALEADFVVQAPTGTVTYHPDARQTINGKSEATEIGKTGPDAVFKIQLEAN